MQPPSRQTERRVVVAGVVARIEVHVHLGAAKTDMYDMYVRLSDYYYAAGTMQPGGAGDVATRRSRKERTAKSTVKKSGAGNEAANRAPYLCRTEHVVSCMLHRPLGAAHVHVKIIFIVLIRAGEQLFSRRDGYCGDGLDRLHGVCALGLLPSAADIHGYYLSPPVCDRSPASKPIVWSTRLSLKRARCLSIVVHTTHTVFFTAPASPNIISSSPTTQRPLVRLLDPSSPATQGPPAPSRLASAQPPDNVAGPPPVTGSRNRCARPPRPLFAHNNQANARLQTGLSCSVRTVGRSRRSAQALAPRPRWSCTRLVPV